MDEKTESLRDIFVEATGTDTVTETQTETPGTLEPDGDVAERLAAVVADCREGSAFSTDLSDTELAALVEGFYQGADDGELAAELSVPEATVVDARLDLRLVRDADTDIPVPLDTVAEAVEDDTAIAALADEAEVDTERLRRCVRALAAQARRRNESDRYRDRFEDILVDAGLESSHTAGTTDDGLEDAIEGMEVDVPL